jgi:hypothetical protein
MYMQLQQEKNLQPNSLSAFFAGWHSPAAPIQPLTSLVACRYNALVQSATADGGFVVLFDGYGTSEEVGKDGIQLQTLDDEGGYKGEWVGRGESRH